MSKIIIIILFLLCFPLASGSTDIGFSISNHGEQVGIATSLDLGTGMAFHEDAWGDPMTENGPSIVDVSSMQGTGKANAAHTISNNDLSVTLTSTGTWLAGSMDRCATILPDYLKSAQKFDAAGYDLGFTAQAVSGFASSKVWMTATEGELAGCQEALATPETTSAFQAGSAFI